MLHKFCWIYLYLLLNAVSLFAQDISNLHIEKVQGEGLTNEFVQYMAQDKNGFMWFGTREGLFRYDGYSFKSFKNLPGDSTSLVDNFITSVYPERKNLWIGTRGGLSCMNINTQVIKNYTPNKFTVTVSSIFAKSDSILWIGSSAGLYQFNIITCKWKALAGIDKHLISGGTTDDNQGHLYIMTQNGFYVYDKSRRVFKYHLPAINAYPQVGKNGSFVYITSTLGTDGNIWMGTWGSGLIKCDVKTGKITQWTNPTDNLKILPYRIIMNVLPDKQGNLWLANKEGGLTIYNPRQNKFFNYPVEWQSENKISAAVMYVYQDRSGIFWIGTENGIFKYDPYHIRLAQTKFHFQADTGLISAQMAPITTLKYKNDMWWMGTYDGLFMFNQKTGVITDYNKILGLTPKWAVFNILNDANGNTWLNSRHTLVKISGNKNDKIKPLRAQIFTSPLIQSTITTMLFDKEGRIWIGTHSSGVFIFDPATNKFTSCNYNERGVTDKIHEIDSFCELSKDSLLIGGQYTGLLLYTGNGRYKKISWPGTSTALTDNLFIDKIYKTGTTIWIGTETNGLWQTDTRLSKLEIKTISDGLPSMSIGGITSDRLNNLWLQTLAGPVEYNTSTKKITLYDKKDGIQNLNGLTTVVAGDGNVYVWGKGCQYNLNPESITKNTSPPGLFITDLKVFDKDYNVQKGQTIELDYNQNYFSLEYLALNYTQSRLNKYAYKMDGLDKKWINAGTRRYVSYANLDEGTYTFNVKACNNEGVWNSLPARITIIIKPPFWHRWWFYLLIFAAIAGTIYVLYAYNINQLKIRLQMRDKIARDLHDDIGSTLSGINIFSKIALQKMNSDRKSSRELLEKISDRSEKTMDALSDIVWSINTRNDGMDNFLMKANEYLTELLEAQGIAYKFTIDPEMEHLKMGMMLRKELYLIFKEAVCNASKYAACSMILIAFMRHKDVCTLAIHDNGKGFDLDAISSGNGIDNMKQRAKKMNAVFHIESGRDAGTLITLRFNIPRFR